MQTAEPKQSLAIIETAVRKLKSMVIVIKTAADYSTAGETLKAIKNAQANVEAFFDDDIQKAYELHRSLTGKKKEFMDPLKAVEASIKNARISFNNEQDRLRREEQKKLDDAAKKKEDDEKKKIDNQIKKAEEKGDTAKVESLQQKKEEVVVHVPQAAERVQQTDGISRTKVWKSEVTDFKALIDAVSAGKAPMALLMVNQSALTGHAKAYKDTAPIAGVRFYEETIERVSSR